MTGSGHSPLRPYTAWKRSDCSVLVGRPVEGPPRCTLMITSGSSVITASPIASVFKASPGPLEAVMPSDPANDAPMAAPMAAISSSAWKVVMRKRRYFDSSWRMSLAGVMGYEPKKSRRPPCCPAATSPSASALFPVMLRYLPGWRRAGEIEYCASSASMVSP